MMELQRNKPPRHDVEELLDPTKVKGVFVPQYSDHILTPTEFSSIIKKQTLSTMSPPKRRRGRPRKNPMTPNLNGNPSKSPAVDTHPSPQRQGEIIPGRCAWKPPCLESDGSYLVVPSPALSTASPLKRIPGSPKKNSSALRFSPQPVIPPTPETNPISQSQQQAHATATPPKRKRGRPRKHQSSPTAPTGAPTLSNKATPTLKLTVAPERLTETKTLFKNTQPPTKVDKKKKGNSINLDHTLPYEKDLKGAALKNNPLYQLNKHIIGNENQTPSTLSSTLSPQTNLVKTATTAEAPAPSPPVAKKRKVMARMYEAAERSKNHKASLAPSIATSHASQGAVNRTKNTSITDKAPVFGEIQRATAEAISCVVAPVAVCPDSTIAPAPAARVTQTIENPVTGGKVPLTLMSASSIATILAPVPVVAAAEGSTATGRQQTLFQRTSGSPKNRPQSSSLLASAEQRTGSAFADAPIISAAEQAPTRRSFSGGLLPSSKRACAVAAKPKIRDVTQHDKLVNQYRAADKRRGPPNSKVAERREARASGNGGLYTIRTYRKDNQKGTPNQDQSKNKEKETRERKLVKLGIDFHEMAERTREVIPGDFGGGLFVSQSDSNSEPDQPAPDLAKSLEPLVPGQAVNNYTKSMPLASRITSTTRKRARQSTNTPSNFQAMGMMEGYFTEVRASCNDIKVLPIIEPSCFINIEENTLNLTASQYEKPFKAQCHLRMVWLTGRTNENGNPEIGGQAVMAATAGEFKVWKSSDYEKLTGTVRLTGTASTFVLPFDAARFKVNGTTNSDGVSTYRIPTTWMFYVWFEPADMFWPPMNLHQINSLPKEGQELTVVKDVKIWAKSLYNIGSFSRQRWKVFTSVGDQRPNLTEAPTKYDLAVHIRWPEWCLSSWDLGSSSPPSSYPQSSSKMGSLQPKEAVKDSSIETLVQEPCLTSCTPPKKKQKTNASYASTVKAPVEHVHSKPIDARLQQEASLTRTVFVLETPEAPEEPKVSRGHPNPAKPPPPPVSKGRPETLKSTEPKPMFKKLALLQKKCDQSRTVTQKLQRANLLATSQQPTPKIAIANSVLSSRSATHQGPTKALEAHSRFPGAEDKLTIRNITCPLCNKLEACMCHILAKPIGKDGVNFKETWALDRKQLYRTQKPENQAAALIESDATITETPSATDTIKVETEHESMESFTSRKATAPVSSPAMTPLQHPPLPSQPDDHGRQMVESSAISGTPSSDDLNKVAISTGSRHMHSHLLADNEYAVPPHALMPMVSAPPVAPAPIMQNAVVEDAVMEDFLPYPPAAEPVVVEPAAAIEAVGVEDAIMKDAVIAPLPPSVEPATTEHAVIEPAQPKYSASALPLSKPLFVPLTINGIKPYNDATLRELIPGEPSSKHPLDTQRLHQNDNDDDTHMTTELTEDEKEFTLFCSEFISADTSRDTASQISFETLRAMVIGNWLWFHQRRPRMTQLRSFLCTLEADGKVTHDVVRKTMTLFTPPKVEKEAYKRVERDTIWTVESLQKNARCREDLWILLKWAWERSKEPLKDPRVTIIRAQYINVASHMLHTYDLHTLNMTIDLLIEAAVFDAKRVKANDSLRMGEVSERGALQFLHNKSLARLRCEYRAYHDAFEKLEAKRVDVANIPGQRWKFLMAFKSTHIRELKTRWEWRRMFEIECHITHVSEELTVEGLLEFLVALRKMGGTADPNAAPDTHPLQITLTASDLKPQELKDATT